MDFYEWNINDPLTVSSLGIPQPTKLKKVYPDILFVPIVAFDKYKNRIVRDIVSQSGAPKPYPNFYMKGTLTEDCIKDSGHFRLSVFFDPEYLTVVDEKNDDFEFLATDLNGGKYKLQILNIDRQKNKVITFDIKDLR